MNGLVVQMCWEQQQPDIIIPSMSGWGGLVGENHHNMTSYSLTISYVFRWLLFILFWLRLLNALASLLPLKPLGGVAVQNEVVWKGFDIETLSLPHEEIFFFLQKTLFSSFSVYFCHCFPRLGNCLASHRCEINMSVGKTQLLSVSF